MGTRPYSASGATNYAYNAANMLLSTSGYGASGFQNDADGNTLSGNGRTNAWDSQNRLVSCIINGNTTAYRYGADGLRRQSTKNGVSTDYANDGSMLVREGHAAGGSLTASTVTATYLIGARGPEYRRDDTQTQTDGQGHTFNGKASWYVFDGLGSVVGEVDPLGNLTSSPKYDVYGAVRSNGGTATTKQGFVGSLGHVSDDTGLVYMRARYYDPATGRFASEDPGQDGSNWFVYCYNNPVNNLDADGKRVVTFAQTGIVLSILIAVGESFVGLNSLIGEPYTALIDWIQVKIDTMLATVAAEDEVAGVTLGTGEAEKFSGADGPGDQKIMGAGMTAEDAARREVAVIELHQVIDMLILTDDYSP